MPWAHVVHRVRARSETREGRPFEELKRRSLVNAAAQAADQAPDFSRRIRAALPAAAGR